MTAGRPEVAPYKAQNRTRFGWNGCEKQEDMQESIWGFQRGEQGIYRKGKSWLRSPVGRLGESENHTGGSRRLFAYFLAGEKVWFTGAGKNTPEGVIPRVCKSGKIFSADYLLENCFGVKKSCRWHDFSQKLRSDYEQPSGRRR